MPHWKSLQGKDFLGSWDFEKGEEKIVTITGYRSEIIKNPQNPNAVEKPRVILEFREIKNAVMNTTNCSMISDLLDSPDIDDWIGRQIILHVERVKGFGKMTDAIRVMDKLPETYICTDCGKAITAAGNWSAERIAIQSEQQFGARLCTACARKRTEDGQHDDPES